MVFTPDSGQPPDASAILGAGVPPASPTTLDDGTYDEEDRERCTENVEEPEHFNRASVDDLGATAAKV
jgi:hypothetical protein